MKTYTLGFLLALFCLVGCSELDQVPEATATKDAVFGSEKGLELYTASFYDNLPSASEIHKGDAMADYSVRTQVPDFLREGAYGPRQSTGWSWTALRNINYFIANNTNPSIPADVRKHYNGIARFFRAWFYYD